jgi:hypothetical protein
MAFPACTKTPSGARVWPREEWPDERPDQPAIAPDARPKWQAWLKKTKGLSDQQWSQVTRRWRAFLSATSNEPDRVLAPNEKFIQWSHAPGETQDDRDRDRFNHDWETRRHIQLAVWDHFDGREGLTERWPPPARRILNQVADPTTHRSFRTLAAKPDVTHRRRLAAVWTALLCFVIHASEDQDGLTSMGLHLSEDQHDDLIDVTQAIAMAPIMGRRYGMQGVEHAVANLCRAWLCHRPATKANNPLRWWSVVLVQSALRGEDDNISSGRFPNNILPMDVDLDTRIEALHHYGKILVLDAAFATWDPRPQHQLQEVQGSLNAVDTRPWIDADTDCRPPDAADARTCDSPAWVAILAHLRSEAVQWLGGQPGTALAATVKVAHMRYQEPRGVEAGWEHPREASTGHRPSAGSVAAANEGRGMMTRQNQSTKRVRQELGET